ncbi:hypothetical protein [Hydrogenimonas sp.]
MTSISSLNASANSFGFTLQTSSGDRISLSMYDNQAVSLGVEVREGYRKTTMSLRHEVGYMFEYEGNGIDARDQKEIEEAMKLIRPMFHKFLENIEKSDLMPGLDERVNLAQLVRDTLPEPKTHDAKTMLKDKTLDTLDEVLAIFERNDKLLEAARDLFDRIFAKPEGFDFYA